MMQASSLVILRVLIIATVVGFASFSLLVTAARDQYSKDSNTSILDDESKMVKEAEIQLERPVAIPSLIATRWTKDADPCAREAKCVDDDSCGTVVDTSDNNRTIYCLCDLGDLWRLPTFTCFDPAIGPEG